MQTYRKPMTAEEIKSLVGDSPLMLEIGSHEGTDTARFLNMMAGIRLFCFDPEQRAIKRFRELISSDARVSLFEKAIADIDGERDFYASTGKAGGREDWDFSGSLCEPTGHYTRSPEIGFKDPEPVPCIRLDTWLSDYPDIETIDFIWADVQGSQRLLIAGGARALSITRYLYIEAHDPIAYAGEPTQEELIDELSEVFTLIAIYAKENILFKNRSLLV